MSILVEHKNDFVKIMEHLRGELQSIRTGRASPALVEGVEVEAYGGVQFIKALASMSTPDSKTLVIEPWDSSVTKAIETAIVAASLGVAPVVDGKVIRLIMPMMTEESRKKLVKTMQEKLEESKIGIRRVREEIRKEVSKQVGVSEDLIRNEQDELDKLTKEFVSEIEELGEKKQEEIMKI